MRYALRNKDKIAKVYSVQILNRMIVSLDAYFTEKKKDIRDDVKLMTGDKYQTLTINDIGHSTSLIAFYVLEKTYDVYRLAFKEFVG